MKRRHLAAALSLHLCEGCSNKPLACLLQEMMCGEEPVGAVLRLLCLLSLTQGGVPKKYYEPLRREVLHSYGHAWLPTLSALQDAGI